MFVRIFLAIAVLALSLAVTEARAGDWISVDGRDCAIWNPDPYEGQKVRWSAKCEGGKAVGIGVAQWYVAERPPDLCECSFIAGKAEGSGIYRWADGVLYVGDFKGGLMMGQGYLKYPDGETYRGGIKNGMPHGKGQVMYPDETIFEGEFRDGAALK
jgi:hypothetical protein